MTVWESIILGIVQGITEFLPVSSSGHLQIAKEILGVRLDDNVTFDVMLHLATVLSTIVVLRKEVFDIARDTLTFKKNENSLLFLKILVSMVPIGIVGFLVKDTINDMLASSYIMLIVGSMLLVTAALLAFATYARPRQREKISFSSAFVIGIAQACAVMPGLSRSGSTISTGILLGNRKEMVARFSFLMVLIPIAGEALLDILKGDFSSGLGIGLAALTAGFAASFVVGYLACRFMIRIVSRGNLVWFAYYCVAMGLFSICWYFFS